MTSWENGKCFVSISQDTFVSFGRVLVPQLMAFAVRVAADGKFGQHGCLKISGLVLAPLKTPAGETRKIPRVLNLSNERNPATSALVVGPTSFFL